MIRRILPPLLAAAAVLLGASAAHAHPLGNFTTNQYAGLRITPTTIEIDYVLDLAELATISERPAVRADPAYPAHACTRLADAAVLTVADSHPTLTTTGTSLTFPPGAAGLSTMRLECAMRAPVQLTGRTPVSFAIGAYSERIGWREITAIGDGVTLDSTLPGTSISRRLTSYPASGLDDPANMRSASFAAKPGGPAAAQTAASGDTVNLAALSERFTRLVGRPELTLPIGLLALLVAVVLGAGHAVAPGHGKTIMAAYLIGQKGHRRQALTIAATVTVTHTAGVLLLGVVIAASFTIAPQSLYRWLAIANGLLVAGIGGMLLRRAIRRTHPHDHDHDHQHHGHDHDHHGGHDHGHHHHHDHDVPRTRTVLAMGLAGGLTPSPSAVVVLLGAAALGRAWYGVLLVIAYGAGMAATLTGVGLALAHFGDRLATLLQGRGRAALLRFAPHATASIIVLVGLGVAGTAALR